MAKFQERVQQVRLRVLTLYWATQDPECPPTAKVVAALVVAYALSPLDLIPDVIPVLGYVDDLVVIPLGAWVAYKMVPRRVLAKAREKAETTPLEPVIKAGIALILFAWAAIILLTWWAWKHLTK